MKLTIITPAIARAQTWALALMRADKTLTVRRIIKPLHEVPTLVNGNVPDLALVDLRDVRDLAALEGFVKAHPSVQCVLVGQDLSSAALMRAMRLGVREVLPAAADAQEVVAAVQRLLSPTAPAGQVVSFIGCKGGSGVTFTVANLACLLAAGGRHRVALLDLNLCLGDALPSISNQAPPSHVASVARSIQRLDTDLLHSAMLEVVPGLHVLAAPDSADQAAHVQPEHVRSIIELATQMFDTVLIDTDRCLNSVTLQALDLSDRIFGVLQLSLPCLRDAKRLQKTFDLLGYPEHKVQWIVNRHEAGGSITLDDFRKIMEMGTPLTLPNQFEVVSRSVNSGVPVAQLAPNSRITRALQAIARQIDVTSLEPATVAPRAAWLSNLWRPGAR